MASSRTATRNQLSNRERPGIGGWRRSLESFRGRRATLLGYIFISHINYPLKRNYARKYPATGSSHVQVPNAQSARWHWRAFPRLWPVFPWLRVISTVYMAYSILKNLYPPLLEIPLKHLIAIRGGGGGPPNCYLLGRFLPNYARHTAACVFAGVHLAWRYFQVYKPAPNYTLSTIYFLLLDDRDIIQYYQLYGQTDSTRQKKTTTPPSVTDGGDHFFHEIMSWCVDTPQGRAHRLRPNRTPAASRALRKHLADSLLIWVAVFVSLTIPISVLVLHMIFQPGRYFTDYPGCSPELERALLGPNGPGPPAGRWLELRLRWHQILALGVDFFENALIWGESGLVTIFPIPLLMLINHDLMLYWRSLDARLERTLAELRLVGWAQKSRDHSLLAGPLCWPSGRGDGSTHRDKAIHELQMEWRDFIRQIEQADAFIGDAITSYVFDWLSLFAVFTYKNLGQNRRSLPPAASMTLLFLLVLVTSYYVSLLVLHRHCLRSYTKICSLMAHDRSAHRLKFKHIMDYFSRERTCYTLCRRQKMTATTYLTLVGWTFSCYFILGSAHRGGL